MTTSRFNTAGGAAGENSNCNLARASTLKLMCLKIGSFLMQDSSNFMERRDKI